MDFDSETMMRQTGVITGKLGEQNFASVFSGLGSFGGGEGVDKANGGAGFVVSPVPRCEGPGAPGKLAGWMVSLDLCFPTLNAKCAFRMGHPIPW